MFSLFYMFSLCLYRWDGPQKTSVVILSIMDVVRALYSYWYINHRKKAGYLQLYRGKVPR